MNNNIAYATNSQGSPNRYFISFQAILFYCIVFSSFWNGGGCTPFTQSNRITFLIYFHFILFLMLKDTFDEAALKIISPLPEKYPPPSQVPPVPYKCTAQSPYSMQFFNFFFHFLYCLLFKAKQHQYQVVRKYKNVF